MSSNIIDGISLEYAKKVKDVEKPNSQEIVHISEDGNESYFQEKQVPFFDYDGNKICDVIIRYDVSDKKIFEKLSTTDALTSLYNRRHFNDVLTREINRANREESKLCFIMIDVDFFKKYNDAYGHQAGDEVLASVAKAIKKDLHRGSDFAFRLGGEEFGILFSAQNETKAFEYADKIRTNVEELKIEHSNSQVGEYITISLGLLYVDFSQEKIDEHGFYTMADDALYQAKGNGRNQVVMYENDNVEFF